MDNHIRRNRVNPEAAAAVMRVAGVEPLVAYPGSTEKWLCRCRRCGSKVTPCYGNVKQGHGGCWPCAQADRQRIPDADAAAVMKAAGLLPLEPYPGSHQRWRCQCTTCGLISEPRYKTLVARGSACKHCAFVRRGRAGRVDGVLAAEVMRKAGVEPLEPYSGAGKRWLCRCLTCDAEVAPSYNNVRIGHAGCIRCSLKATAGVSQRLAHEEAAAFMLEQGLEPLDPYRNSTDPWRCQCMACGREVTPRYGNVKQGSGGCSWCVQKAVDPEEAAAVMRAADLEPLTKYPGTSEPWKCRCQRCRRTVYPRYKGVRYRQSGCRWCASHGFTSTDEATVYLIEHAELGAVKIGITNEAGNRISVHHKKGWQVLALVPVPGELAVTIEKSILDWWRKDLNLPPYLGKHEMPQGGWTETVDADAIDTLATVERIKALAA